MSDALKRFTLILVQAGSLVLTPMPAFAEDAASSMQESDALEPLEPQTVRIRATDPEPMPSGHRCFDNPKLPRRSAKKQKTITTAQSAR